MSTRRSTARGLPDLDRRLGKLTVGEFLRTWRMSEEMSLKEFGNLVGMSIANLCDVEKAAKVSAPKRPNRLRGYRSSTRAAGALINRVAFPVPETVGF